jgi:superfamily I DNA and/or RNA helicase
LSLVEELCRRTEPFSSFWHSPDRIRIITFYQEQVKYMQQLFRKHGYFDRKTKKDKIVIATVDSSQGCEADIVIVSFVRSYRQNKDIRAGFLTDNRRMNVALTRARFQLICIGNIEALSQLNEPNTETIRELTQDAKERKLIRSRQVREVIVIED